MNLAPVDVEYAHGDGPRRPVDLGDKRNCAGRCPCGGGQFSNDGRSAIKELDSILHLALPSAGPSAVAFARPGACMRCLGDPSVGFGVAHDADQFRDLVKLGSIVRGNDGSPRPADVTLRRFAP
jgi:hypothetical protein